MGGRFKECDTAARVLEPCLQVLFASHFAAWIKISRSQWHQQHHDVSMQLSTALTALFLLTLLCYRCKDLKRQLARHLYSLLS